MLKETVGWLALSVVVVAISMIAGEVEGLHALAYILFLVPISIIGGMLGGWVDNNTFGNDFWMESVAIAAAIIFWGIFLMMWWITSSRPTQIRNERRAGSARKGARKQVQQPRMVE